MKKAFTFSSTLVRAGLKRHHSFSALFFFLLLALVSNNGAAQSTASAPPDPITTDGYSHDVWRLPNDYAIVLTIERDKAAVVLADPNSNEEQTALYTGYDKMLAYMQIDLAANEPIDGISLSGFKKVKLEALTDPKLAKMQAASFATLYEALVILLHY